MGSNWSRSQGVLPPQQCQHNATRNSELNQEIRNQDIRKSGNQEIKENQGVSPPHGPNNVNTMQRGLWRKSFYILMHCINATMSTHCNEKFWRKSICIPMHCINEPPPCFIFRMFWIWRVLATKQCQHHATRNSEKYYFTLRCIGLKSLPHVSHVESFEPRELSWH